MSIFSFNINPSKEPDNNKINKVNKTNSENSYLAREIMPPDEFIMLNDQEVKPIKIKGIRAILAALGLALAVSKNADAINNRAIMSYNDGGSSSTLQSPLSESKNDYDPTIDSEYPIKFEEPTISIKHIDSNAPKYQQKTSWVEPDIKNESPEVAEDAAEESYSPEYEEIIPQQEPILKYAPPPIIDKPVPEPPPIAKYAPPPIIDKPVPEPPPILKYAPPPMDDPIPEPPMDSPVLKYAPPELPGN